MRRVLIARALLATVAALAGVALAADAAAPGNGPGWTGITNPKDVITARQELMEEIEHLMEPIDTFQVKDDADAEKLRASAGTIAAMLLAVPHLFPPPTNLHDPTTLMPETLALPAIWKDFGAFYKLAANASSAAQKMAETTGKEPLRAAGSRLRASCDACHALYLRVYVPPKFMESDYEFDFESALRKD